MRGVIIVILLLVFGCTLKSQDGIIFDFASDIPADSVTHIFINLNFNLVHQIPEHIGRYKNLTELTIFQQSEFFLGNNWNQSFFRPVDYDEADIRSVPSSIAKCKRLKILQIREGHIDFLPPEIVQLDSLHTLQLPDGSNLNNLVPVLLQLKDLRRLHCYTNKLSNANRIALHQRFPNIVFVVSEDDIFQELRQTRKYDHVVDINDMKAIGFYRQKEADMFVASTPEDMRAFYNVSVRR